MIFSAWLWPFPVVILNTAVLRTDPETRRIFEHTDNWSLYCLWNNAPLSLFKVRLAAVLLVATCVYAGLLQAY
jgi:hypothetical protein